MVLLTVLHCQRATTQSFGEDLGRRANYSTTAKTSLQLLLYRDKKPCTETSAGARISMEWRQSIPIFVLQPAFPGSQLCLALPLSWTCAVS